MVVRGGGGKGEGGKAWRVGGAWQGERLETSLKGGHGERLVI